MVITVIISSVPLAQSVSTCQGSFTVKNSNPLFIRYWIDGQGPVEYVSNGTFSKDR